MEAALRSLVARGVYSPAGPSYGWILVLLGSFALLVSGYFLMLHWDAILDASLLVVSNSTLGPDWH